MVDNIDGERETTGFKNQDIAGDSCLSVAAAQISPIYVCAALELMPPGEAGEAGEGGREGHS